MTRYLGVLTKEQVERAPSTLKEADFRLYHQRFKDDPTRLQLTIAYSTSFGESHHFPVRGKYCSKGHKVRTAPSFHTTATA